ncbi:Speckle-type POZ protein B [Aphelenchoides bicaudatus]|nr:Speckle-type POZ protein B [Aphelenchoides bicaudatus]
MPQKKANKIKWGFNVFDAAFTTQAYASSNPIPLPNDPDTKFILFFKRSTVEFTNSIMGVTLSSFDGNKKVMQVKFWIEDTDGQKFGKQMTSNFEFACEGDKCAFLLQNESAKRVFNTFENGALNWGVRNINLVCKLIYVDQPVKLNAAPKTLDLFRKNLLSAYTNNEDWDTLIKVDEKEFKVHRLILTSQSTVFKKMFSNKYKESELNEINIEDVKAPVMEEFIYWLYRGAIRKVSDLIEDLFALANKYDVVELKVECVRHLADTLNDENSGRRLVLATFHNEDDLKDYILGVIAKKKPASHFNLFWSDEWVDFTNKFTQDAKEVVAAFRSKIQ